VKSLFFCFVHFSITISVSTKFFCIPLFVVVAVIPPVPLVRVLWAGRPISGLQIVRYLTFQELTDRDEERDLERLEEDLEDLERDRERDLLRERGLYFLFDLCESLTN
jgi:hypothetical protein